MFNNIGYSSKHTTKTNINATSEDIAKYYD